MYYDSNVVEPTMLKTNSECMYCGKCFHFQDLYDNHVPTCEYFYHSKKERHRSIEAIETLPSAHDMYRLIQHLTATCRKLEDKVQKLEQQATQRTRRNIFRQLATLPTPRLTLQQWFAQLPVTQVHLDVVFDPFLSLVDGMRHALRDAFDDAERAAVVLPFRSFASKPDVLYIYTKDTGQDVVRWRTCTPDVWQHVVDTLARHFLRAFCVWEDDHAASDLLPDEKDKHVRYMIKVSGRNAIRDKERHELKAWFIRQVSYNDKTDTERS